MKKIIARRAASYGAKVCLVEGSRLGGTCVNVGCVPKKVCYNLATLKESIHEAPYYGIEGIDQSSIKLNYSLFKEKRDAYIHRLNGIYANNLSKDGVDVISGFASFEPHPTNMGETPKAATDLVVAVQSGTGEKTLLQGDHVLIATGGRPLFPKSVPGYEHGISSDGFFELKTLPKKVAVVGAGYIGIELAGVFHYLGSDVTVFLRHKNVLKAFDDMVQLRVKEEYQRIGIKFVEHSDIQSIDKLNESELKVTYNQCENPDLTTNCVTKTETFESLVWSIGRVPNIDSLGLQHTGIHMDKWNHVMVDEWQNTAMKNVYALGDVCGIAQLTPVAIMAGRKLADRVFGAPKGLVQVTLPDGSLDPFYKMEYHTIPTVVFSHPPVGTIGLTESEAKAKYGGENVRVYESKFTNMYYSMMDYKPVTHYKLITLLNENERVIGLHMFGIGSDEILQGFGVAMKMGATKRDFDRVVPIHPTAAEEVVTMRGGRPAL